MPIDTSIEKAILKQLYDAFPGEIKNFQEILPENKNRNVILNYLFDFKDQGWVKFIDLSSKDGKDCCDIKVTRSGLDYLKRLTSPKV